MVCGGKRSEELQNVALKLLTKLRSFSLYPLYIHRCWQRCKDRSALASIRAQILYSGGTVPSSVVFHGAPIVSIVEGSSIEIGENCLICSDSEMTALGVNHPVVMRTLRPGARIIIGQNTGISGGSICSAVSVKVGSECLIGANVVIADTDFHPVDPVGRSTSRDPMKISAEPVEIEDNVFVGTGAIILKGVKVGRNSVIGAGSVVVREVPPDSIVAGNPARVVGKL